MHSPAQRQAVVAFKLFIIFFDVAIKCSHELKGVAPERDNPNASPQDVSGFEVQDAKARSTSDPQAGRVLLHPVVVVLPPEAVHDRGQGPDPAHVDRVGHPSLILRHLLGHVQHAEPYRSPRNVHCAQIVCRIRHDAKHAGSIGAVPVTHG